MSWGPTSTWKVVYVPKMMDAGRRGVALVEAVDRQTAMYYFMCEYDGQFHTVESCTKLA